MKRKLSPLVQAITLYNSLDERDKVTLGEYIKSQTVRIPKSTTVPGAGKKSKQKSPPPESVANTGDKVESVTTATSGVCQVPNCGLPESDMVHFIESEPYHKFHAVIKTKGAGA